MRTGRPSPLHLRRLELKARVAGARV